MELLQRRLTLIWLGGAGLIFATMIGMSFGGQFGEKTQAVWEWLTPNIMPSVGPVVATATATALQQRRSDKEVRKDFAVLVQVISLVYLLNLLVFIGGKQSIAIDTDHWMKLLRLSNFWLSALQAAMIPMLGVVFLSRREHPEPAVERGN